MTGMTQAATIALRQPFPAETIGKLPKSSCRACSDSPRKRCDNHTWVTRCPECHGSHASSTVHLDYVGHAAVTDRLLAIDPLWSWEPLALDAVGLPAFDGARNLWIRLTILGVTRLGVGDGKSAKEAIGDAIRNAAMRFGVALDLWAKDDLVEFRRAHALTAGDTEAPKVAEPTPTAATSPLTDPGEFRPVLRTAAQSTKIHALLGEAGLSKDRDHALRVIGGFVGRQVESTKDLTKAEAGVVIEMLGNLGQGATS